MKIKINELLYPTDRASFYYPPDDSGPDDDELQEILDDTLGSVSGPGTEEDTKNLLTLEAQDGHLIIPVKAEGVPNIGEPVFTNAAYDYKDLDYLDYSLPVDLSGCVAYYKREDFGSMTLADIEQKLGESGLELGPHDYGDAFYRRFDLSGRNYLDPSDSYAEVEASYEDGLVKVSMVEGGILLFGRTY